MQARITHPRAGSERRTAYPSGLGSGGFFGGGGVHGSTISDSTFFAQKSQSESIRARRIGPEEGLESLEEAIALGESA